MRILHVLEATHGGTRRHILDLLPALQQRGITSTLICSPLRDPHFEDDAKYLQERGIAVLPLEMTRGFSRVDGVTLRALAHHLRAHRYDVLHCHSTKAGLLGRLAASVAAPRLPVIYTPHCVAFDTGLPLPLRRAARWMEMALAPRTAHFIAVSRHEARALQRLGIGQNTRKNHRRISVIYNGIDLSVFDALLANTSPEQNSPADERFTIGCFGRLTRQKNQQVLLHALALLNQKISGARLLLVGDGEDRTALQVLARHLGIAEQIEWAGEVPEARPFYRRCDVVAQPSRWEGCPYSLLEAMAARRAVLSSWVGGVPELLQSSGDEPEAGVLCRPCQAAQIADALAALQENRRRREALGAAARTRVEARFSLAQMVEKTIAVYEKVAIQA